MFFFLQTSLLIFSSTAVSRKDRSEDVSFTDEGRYNPSEKISTSLRLEDDLLANETDKIRDVLTIVSRTFFLPM